MKLLAPLAAMLALIGSPVETARPIAMSYAITTPSPFNGTFEVVPKITCVSPNGIGIGSGVRVSDDIVITATHVVAPGSRCRIDNIVADPTYVSRHGDFMALRAPMQAGLRAIVSCEGIVEGQRYLALGYAFGGKPNVALLIGTDDREQGQAALSGRVFVGMSGGAVFDLSTGAVVAIINQRAVEVSTALVTPLSETYLCGAKP